MTQPAQELVQLLLPIRQLPTPAVIDAEEGHDAVDDQEAVFVCRKRLIEDVEEFELVLAVLRARVEDVFAGAFGVDYVM